MYLYHLSKEQRDNPAHSCQPNKPNHTGLKKKKNHHSHLFAKLLHAHSLTHSLTHYVLGPRKGGYHLLLYFHVKLTKLNYQNNYFKYKLDKTSTRMESIHLSYLRLQVDIWLPSVRRRILSCDTHSLCIAFRH